jgi:WhiB family redox-sensing transcriptional regulator
VPLKNRLPCRTVDPDIFFPVGYTGPAIAQAELAKSFCHRCPVEQECLDWALDTGVEFGVWGGTTEQERAATRRRSYGHKPRRTDADRAPMVAELASA